MYRLAGTLIRLVDRNDLADTDANSISYLSSIKFGKLRD